MFHEGGEFTAYDRFYEKAQSKKGTIYRLQVQKGRNFTSLSKWKAREICH